MLIFPRRSIYALFVDASSRPRSAYFLPSFKKRAVRHQSTREEIHDCANARGAPEVIVRE